MNSFSVSLGSAAVQEIEASFIFPLDSLHNHANCLVECPDGQLLACWYRGSGERRADDVRIMGARKAPGGAWSEPFVMADYPGFPDCNPALLVDPQARLWLFWPVILANQWHTALLMSRRAERYAGPGCPEWTRERPVLFKPGPEFIRTVVDSVARDLRRADGLPPEPRERAVRYLEERRRKAEDPYYARMGWMPRAHPLVLEDGRLILPLYSDGFDFSLVVYSDDEGETWSTGTPIVGDGPVQPSVVQRADGTLVAFMRDNGGPPKRLLASESRDRGETWTPAADTDLPNPGSGAEVIRLRSGRWALIYNDTERGRHSLAVSLSADEGATWPWTRHLERDPTPEGPRTFAYPSLIQAGDGSLHATYTYTAGAYEPERDAEGRLLRECIKHARFSEAWVQAGDPGGGRESD